MLKTNEDVAPHKVEKFYRSSLTIQTPVKSCDFMEQCLQSAFLYLWHYLGNTCHTDLKKSLSNISPAIATYNNEPRGQNDLSKCPQCLYYLFMLSSPCRHPGLLFMPQRKSTLVRGVVWTPIRYVTLHFRDQRGAASLRYRNGAKITFLKCEQMPYPIWFPCRCNIFTQTGSSYANFLE